MTKKILVSIVTITYNHEEYIKEALDSFLMQDVDFDIEIIVADDASTDATQKIVDSYAQKFPNIIRPVLRKKNIGAIPNSIDALKHATGDYIALCEGDDYWSDKNKLQKQVDYFTNNPQASVCFHPTKVVSENSDEDASVWPNKVSKSTLTTLSLITENFIPTNSVMYKRQDYSNLPNNVMPFDWYLHLYHAQFGDIGYLPDVMSVYRRHEGSLWWNSDKSPYEHWERYGIQMFALLAEVEKMYGDNAMLKEQVKKGYSSLMQRLALLEKEDAALLTKIADNFSEESANAFKVLALELDSKLQEGVERDAKIADLEAELVALRLSNFKLKDEVHTLRNSRVIGRIIKARESAGAFKRGLKSNVRHAPLKMVSKTKRGISKLSPEFVKPHIRAYVLHPARKIHRMSEARRQKGAVTYQASIVYAPNAVWTQEQPLVSVVVPYYNRADTIDDTVQSLKNQTFKNFEVIIVNDGSPQQESIDKLTLLKKQNPTYIFLDQKNQGVAATRNNGIKVARGKYIICLDSDDMIEPTYIEKCSILLESNQDIGLITTYRRDFGVSTEEVRTATYDPIELYSNNMVTTAAQFRKKAWETSGGYKSGIGYEDWEYWLTLAEHGFWANTLPELLFTYRVAMSSRFVEDKEAHWNNIKLIQGMHKDYIKKIHKIAAKRRAAKTVSTIDTALINLKGSDFYAQPDSSKKNILITIPWMTFGGAETLIYNYCRQIKNDFNITFMTGLDSQHEWEYKFREITPRIYHLTNLFNDERMYIEFLSNYISTRSIDVLHIIHNDFTFDMLPELKKRHPNLRVIVTMFNDRVGHFEKSLSFADYIDTFTSDNSRVTKHYQKELGDGISTVVIPNGVDCYTTFKVDLFDRQSERKDLGIESDDLAVFFVGRLSEEKNPDVFVAAAKNLLITQRQKNLKFFIVGDGGMRQQIEDAIKETGSKDIIYLGYQSEVAKYLSAADIFVLPSSIEGFPLSILEAMSMKVAVIASDVGAVSEVLQTGVDGFVITPGSADEISDSIKTLKEDTNLLNDMKNKSRLKVESNYSNTILGGRYTGLYNGTEK